MDVNESMDYAKPNGLWFVVNRCLLEPVSEVLIGRNNVQQTFPHKLASPSQFN